MVEIQPIRVELEREEDGRFLASVPELPGVMAYGATQEEAVRKAKSIALQVLADMIESGEEVPEPLRLLFCGVSTWRATKARRVHAALLRLGWMFKKQVGSHRKLQRDGWPNFTFSFQDSEEVGPAALPKIAKGTGLRPEDL